MRWRHWKALDETRSSKVYIMPCTCSSPRHLRLRRQCAIKFVRPPPLLYRRAQRVFTVDKYINTCLRAQPPSCGGGSLSGSGSGHRTARHRGSRPHYSSEQCRKHQEQAGRSDIVATFTCESRTRKSVCGGVHIRMFRLKNLCSGA